jgi:hypothetical protein
MDSPCKVDEIAMVAGRLVKARGERQQGCER